MKRLLFISHRVPYPPDKGERVRAFHEIRALAEHFRVTLAYLAHDRRDGEAAGPLGQWCEQVLFAPAGGKVGWLRGGLAMLAGRSVTEGYFASRAMRRLLAEETAREPFGLVFAYCTSALPYAVAVPAARRVIDLVDVDSAKWAAYAESARWPKSWLFRREAAGVRALERRAAAEFDAALLVSPAEVAVADGPADKLIAISNGVDLDYFAPAGAPSQPPSVVFTGQMDYRPNVEGVCWFVQRVWPGLRQAAPELTFQIVGRSPAKAVQDLAAQPGVIVTGAVPDVRPYLSAATAAVVPLRIARGIQNKVLEAMAMGRAVVASPAALAGLDVHAGRELLQADAPDQWRDHIVALLREPGRRDGLGAAARACVAARYTWSARLEPLVSLCLRLAGA